MSIIFQEGGNIKQYEKDIESLMDKHVKFLETELQKLRTGRANPAMVEDIKVHAYGTAMPIKELAAVTVPDAAFIVIEPWDKAVIGDIERALNLSDLSVNAQSDGDVIRIKIPPMSSSRRDELAKVLNQKLEAARVAIRKVRQDIQNNIRDTEKAKKISQDFSKKLQEMLQKVTDKFIKLGEHIAAKKEGEIKSL